MSHAITLRENQPLQQKTGYSILSLYEFLMYSKNQNANDYAIADAPFLYLLLKDADACMRVPIIPRKTVVVLQM